MRATELRLVMMGTGTFAEPTFRALLEGGYNVAGLVTQPDRPTGARRGSTRQVGAGMKEIAQARGVPVLQPESVNTPEGVAALQGLRPDLLVVAAYGQILSNEVLAAAAHGGINVHASLLPKYRGAAPVAWAIYHGEKVTGVTIIRMSVQLDAGDMLAQESVKIGPEETAGELEARLAEVGARLALRVLDQTAAGTARGVKQDKSQVTKAPKLTKEHGLIDWNRTAVEVCNHVRAMQPWPTAYTFLHQQGRPPLRVIICRASGLRRPPTPGPSASGSRALPLGRFIGIPMQPGFLNPFAKQCLQVAAGGISFVEVSELQPAGKKRMTAAEFLRGYPIKEGDHFGPESP
jgi:methionyl-tRNA formyltransferase